MTNPQHTRITRLIHEAVCADWLPEGTIAAHIRAHELAPVLASTIGFTLRELKRQGRIESITFPGHTGKHWRKVSHVA